jgi:hypothetical protein
MPPIVSKLARAGALLALLAAPLATVPLSAGPRAVRRPVTFASADGVSVRAHLGLPARRGSGAPAVVLIQAGGSDPAERDRTLERLQGLGYVVLAYDGRATDPGRASGDLKSAVAYLKTLDAVDPDRIGVLDGPHSSRPADPSSLESAIEWLDEKLQRKEHEA